MPIANINDHNERYILSTLQCQEKAWTQSIIIMEQLKKITTKKNHPRNLIEV